MTDKLLGDLRAELIDAIGEDRYVPVDRLLQLGVPRKHARNLATASRWVTSLGEADETARRWAGHIAADQEREAAPGLDPVALAAQVQTPF